MIDEAAGNSARKFLLTTFLPVIAGMLLLLVSTAAFMLWSTRAIDRLSIENQRIVVESAIQRLRTTLAHDQESSTVWGDAREAAVARDAVWLDANLGTWMHDYFRHDELYVLDPRDNAIYSFAHGAVADQAAFARVGATLRPMVARLRSRVRAGEQPQGEGAAKTIGESDFALIDARPAIVSVKPITNDDGFLSPDEGVYVHISVRFLDRDFLDDLSRTFRLFGLRFSWLLSPGDEFTELTIHSSNTTIHGYFVWDPKRPGLAFLKMVAPWLIGIACLIAIGTVVLMLLLYRHKRAQALTEAQLGFVASHDPLTGLPNQMQMSRAVDVALHGLPTSEPDQVVAVAVIDLDDLKRVNDAFGRSGGDEVVRAQAARLGEVAYGRSFVGRLSGDEFAIVLWDRTAEEVEHLFAEVIQRLALPVTLGDQSAACGASLGYALAPQHGVESGELMRKAGVALHQAKVEGRNRSALFGKHMDVLLSDRAALERDLLASLGDKPQIEVFYQPKLASQGLRVVGLEALARWQHPERGWVSPAVFIPIAEECGFIHPLGLFVLEESCRAAAHWDVASVAVNVSARQLRDRTFLLDVVRILSDTGLPADRLELELTEGSWMDERGVCPDTIRALRGLGVRIALDDFGTGFSSFGRLHSTDVDRIKIDQSFVAGFGKGRGDEAIVRAIIEMAKAKGLMTTAEGVETAEQCALLQAMGCDDLQGYLFSRPLPPDRMEVFLGSTVDHRSEATAGSGF